MTQRRDYKGRSVYAAGASDGLWMGLVMGACVLCMIGAARIPILSLFGVSLFLCAPFVAWMLVRREWLYGSSPGTFSAVWLHGICMFLFGSLIMALFMYVGLRFVCPGWIESQTLLAARQLSESPDTAEQSRMLMRVIEEGQMPSPIYTSISSIWLVSFTGSLWSMIFAFILTRTKHFRDKRAKKIIDTLGHE